MESVIENHQAEKYELDSQIKSLKTDLAEKIGECEAENDAKTKLR